MASDLASDLQADAEARKMVPAPYVPQAPPANVTVAGEFLPAAQNPDECSSMPYQGIAAGALPDKAIAVLLAPVVDSEVEIRSFDGLIYVPGVRYRDRLNKALGPGAWGIHPRGITVQGAFVCYRGSLYILGRFISEAIGENRYVENNAQMSYAAAAEAAKTDCIVRCCKDLGMFSQLWDPAFGREWIAKHAEKVGGKWARKEDSFYQPRTHEGTEGQVLQIEALHKGDRVRGRVTVLEDTGWGRLSHFNAQVGIVKGEKWPEWYQVGAYVEDTISATGTSPSSGKPYVYVTPSQLLEPVKPEGDPSNA